MSGVSPIGPLQEFSSRLREEEMDRLDPNTQPPAEDTSPQVVKSDAAKQAEKTTLYNFKYTGTGSFIDKVF